MKAIEILRPNMELLIGKPVPADHIAQLREQSKVHPDAMTQAFVREVLDAPDLTMDVLIVEIIERLEFSVDNDECWEYSINQPNAVESIRTTLASMRQLVKDDVIGRLSDKVEARIAVWEVSEHPFKSLEEGSK